MINLFKFWDKHNKIEDDELRVMLADTVIVELQAVGWSESRLQKKQYIHPQIRRKDKFTRYSLLEILADFIMKPLQRDEVNQEYPVINADASNYAATKRKDHEYSFDSVTIDAGGVKHSQPRVRDQLYYGNPRTWWGDVVSYNTKDIPLKPSFIGARSCAQQWKKIINIS